MTSPYDSEPATHSLIVNLLRVPVYDRNMPPDSRMANFVGGWDANGHLPMNPGALRRIADSWATTPSTPEDIAGLLKISRDLFIASF